MAAVDYFLKIEGIEGESADSKHKGEIDVESWSWGETNLAGGFGGAIGGGGGAGKVQMQDFHFTMKTSKASPKLMLACASGKHIQDAVLTARKAGGDPNAAGAEFMKFTLADVLVSSYQVGGSSSSETVPTDQIALNFGQIKFDYRPQLPDGTLGDAVSAAWDLKRNQSL